MKGGKEEPCVESSQDSHVGDEIRIELCIEILINLCLICDDDRFLEKPLKESVNCLDDGDPIDLDQGFFLAHANAFSSRKNDACGGCFALQ